MAKKKQVTKKMASKKVAIKKKKKIDCEIDWYVSQAGRLLRTSNSKAAGRILSTQGKQEKAKRIARGCLNGPPGTFKLTDKQKKNLPPALQRAILVSQRSKGKRIIQ